jgi:lipoate-protein ligase A
MKKIRLIWDETHSAAYNMACDDVLFHESQSLDPLNAILRFYSFQQNAITMGVSQKAREDRFLTDAYTNHADITRRITGGGVVIHVNDIPYTFIAHVSFSELLETVESSYCVLHDLLRSLFGDYGITTTFSDESSSLFMGEHNCFVRPVANDLLCNGVKIAGAAQKRKKGWILHQGSIAISQCFATCEYHSFSRALADLLADKFKAICYCDPLTSAEKNKALNLSTAQYERKEWILRR